MILKKPKESPQDTWGDFYKFKLSENNNFKYFLTPKELERFQYSQVFIKDLKGVVLFPSVSNTDVDVNKSMLNTYNPDLICSNPGRGGAFGDSLGWISFICRLSEASGKTIKLARLAQTAINIKNSILNTSGLS